jgi:hypothetical protein
MRRDVPGVRGLPAENRPIRFVPNLAHLAQSGPDAGQDVAAAKIEALLGRGCKVDVDRVVSTLPNGGGRRQASHGVAFQRSRPTQLQSTANL